METTDESLHGTPLAPLDRQEVWAAGVTYKRSLTARSEESREPDVYERVYDAERPELFFKSTAERVVGPGGSAMIRSDSTWDVPEPELALVIDSTGRIFGYTIGDDVSSRSIEGENPLYLPQAKVYERACALGPWIVTSDEAEPPFGISMQIIRDGEAVFQGETSTESLKRDPADLARWLYAGLRFPHGAVLLTGTGLVPGDDFTLKAGDEVSIEIDRIGRLTHAIALLDLTQTLEGKPR